MESDGEFWAGYRGSRILGLGRPLDETEETQARWAASALQSCLGIEPADARRQAHRCIMYRRETLMHEVLMNDHEPRRVGEILDKFAVEGIEHARSLDPDRPLIVTSLHYSLYSSMLWLWLARATGRGLFRHLTVMYDRGPDGYLWIEPSRRQEMEKAGLGLLGTLTFLDKRSLGARGAAKQLVNRLAAAGAAFLLPDSNFIPVEEKGALTVRIGSRTVGFPRGLAWLVGTVRCPILPVHIRPRGDTYCITFSSPIYPSREGDIAPVVESTIRGLLQQTVLVDPGLWERWLNFPVAPAPETGGER